MIVSMEPLEKKLGEIEELIKGSLMPKMNTPSLMPRLDQPHAVGRPRGTGMPKNPFDNSPNATVGTSPASKKNPVAIAQQIQNKESKETQIKQAKEGLSFSSRGQWSLRR